MKANEWTPISMFYHEWPIRSRVHPNHEPNFLLSFHPSFIPSAYFPFSSPLFPLPYLYVSSFLLDPLSQFVFLLLSPLSLFLLLSYSYFGVNYSSFLLSFFLFRGGGKGNKLLVSQSPNPFLPLRLVTRLSPAKKIIIIARIKKYY